MGISDELTRQFAKETVGKSDRDTGKTVTGTAVRYNGSMYVRIDGSDQITPIISSTVGMKEGDRVTVLIKDHTTTVTGNTTAPSISQDDVNNSNQEIVDKITEVEILVAEKASIKDLEAESARIDDLVADNVTIKDKLTVSKAEIDQLKAKDVEISGNLTAHNAEIENLKATKLDTEIADIKYATIGSLEATNADIHNLKADYGEFKQLSTDKFAANDASIKKLEAEKANIKDLDAKYANIDFANIGEAAIKKLFSDSGIIKDLVVSQGHITGELVGVTIKGDLIEGGTVKADKLVVQGEDGLYYKLNVSAEKVSAQQTEYNSLNGSIITAKSITAEKVNVNDLVAFGATIGGFHITDSAIYSGVKESVNNTTRGTYMDDDGQFAIGDGSNYLKFFRDSNGEYKLDISASSIRFGTSGETVENVIQDMVVKTETEYYISTSSTELSGGSWSLTSPIWSAGKYIWTRTKSTKKSGTVEYSNPACTTGAPGNPGADGVGIKSTAVTYQAGSSQTSAPTGSWATSVPKLSAATPYLWTRTVVTYTNNTTSTSYSVSSTLDGVEVGGRNIALRTSDNLPSDWHWSMEAGDVAESNETVDGENAIVFTRGQTEQSGWSYIGFVPIQASKYKSSTSYTISFDVYPFVDTNLTVNLMSGDGSTSLFTKTVATYPATAPANKWTRVTAVGTTLATLPSTRNQILYIQGMTNSVGGKYKFKRVKIEAGNKATDWTPAPEDVQQGIDHAQTDANNANNKIDNEIAPDIEYSKSQIEILNKSIASLVVDQNGGSLMTQTPDGWKFNIGAIQSGLSGAIGDIQEIQGDINGVKDLADKTNELANDVAKKTAYINMAQDESGQPVMELGQQNGEFKLRITNTSMDFMQGSQKIAYLSNRQLYIQSSVVTDEMKIGATSGYIWKKRANGNMGLRYITS